MFRTHCLIITDSRMPLCDDEYRHSETQKPLKTSINCFFNTCIFRALM